MPSTLIDAFELIVEADQLAPRLEAAATALAQLEGLDEEQGWLAAARARLAGVGAADHRGLLDRALRLVELEGLKGGERGKALQAAVADEVERLQAGIVLAGGARSPLLDTLFLNLKVPALRKCGRAELDRFCAELERRLASTYAQRMLATERHLSVVPLVASLAAAVATWRAVFIDPPPAAEDAERLGAALMAAGASVERAVRQARLLAQAALLPAGEQLDAAGVVNAIAIAKARRRGSKDADPDSHPLLDRDPPDPDLPTDAERAELADGGASA